MARHRRREPTHEENLRSLAYHESGHAVVGHHFGQGISAIMLFGGNGGSIHGRAEFPQPDDAVSQIAVHLAGLVAEERLNIAPNLSPSMAQAWINIMLKRGREDPTFWQDPYHWQPFYADTTNAAFTALGFELPPWKPLPREEALERLARGRQLLDEVLDARWDGVERLGDSLLVHCRSRYYIPGDEVMRILGPVPAIAD